MQHHFLNENNITQKMKKCVEGIYKGILKCLTMKCTLIK